MTKSNHDVSRLCHCVDYFLVVVTWIWTPAVEGHGGDLPLRSIPPADAVRWRLPFTESWVITGLRRDLRPPRSFAVFYGSCCRRWSQKNRRQNCTGFFTPFFDILGRVPSGGTRPRGARSLQGLLPEGCAYDPDRKSCDMTRSRNGNAFLRDRRRGRYGRRNTCVLRCHLRSRESHDALRKPLTS